MSEGPEAPAQPSPEAVPGAEAPWLPGVAVFLGAFLLFQAQPLVGRMVLPLFGGTAGVWTTCLLFFQVLVLLGSLHAHAAVQGLAPRTQAVLQGGLVLAALLTLPLRFHGALGLAGLPALRLLVLLLGAVGLPAFLLVTTGPLVQSWVAREGRSPYRLYALSNLGSMAALLSYPVAVEPFVPLAVQAWIWSGLFVLQAGLVLVLARRSAALPEALPGRAPAPAPPPPRGRRVLEVLLAAVPCALLMAVTSHLSANVAPIPFLWVAPLALYLLTFILCFEGGPWYERRIFLPLLPVLLVAMSLLLLPSRRFMALSWQLPVYGAGLFVACMVAHGELARRRPDPRHLTGFYLRLGLGGALGGALVAVAAPLLFDSFLELPLGLAASAALAFLALATDPGRLPPALRRGGLGAFALLAGGLLAHALLVDGADARSSVARGRTFHGILAVKDREGGAWRTLTHGTITHGGQFRDPARALEPVTYYREDSGLGMAMASLDPGPRRIGVLGLGAGCMGAYGRPGDLMRFYELDPQVEAYARRYFTYLSEGKAAMEVLTGDARLTLAGQAPQAYDLLVMDAFSGDAVPVHLLTFEAFEVYFRHLKAEGILAVNISNRYLDLGPVLLAAARRFGRSARVVTTSGIYRSRWVLLAPSEAFFGRSGFRGRGNVRPLEGRAVAWTDDFSNLLGVLRQDRAGGP